MERVQRWFAIRADLLSLAVVVHSIIVQRNLLEILATPVELEPEVTGRVTRFTSMTMPKRYGPLEASGSTENLRKVSCKLKLG